MSAAGFTSDAIARSSRERAALPIWCDHAAMPRGASSEVILPMVTPLVPQKLVVQPLIDVRAYPNLYLMTRYCAEQHSRT